MKTTELNKIIKEIKFTDKIIKKGLLVLANLFVM